MEKQFDLIIIGSGPAGLAAAVYAQRAKLDTLIIEKEMMSGGQVLNTYEVDNYPGLPGINGFDLGMKLREHADRLEAVFCTDEVRAIEDAAQDAEKDAEKGAAQDAEKDAEQNEAQDAGEDVLEAAELHPVSGTGAGRTQAPLKRVVGVNDTYLAKAVLIASGAMHSKLGVPGEERLAGMGVSYCATCDGAFFRNKVTAVVGGGDVAIEDAIFLARMCRHVYLIHRRDALRGAKSLQEKLFALDNVTVVWDSVVEEIQGGDRVERLAVKQVKTGERSELAVDGVFIAVGITPNSKPFEGLVEMDHGYILADETCATGTPGIFAAGDVRRKQLRQIVTAVADGANAVTSVERYLTAQ